MIIPAILLRISFFLSSSAENEDPLALLRRAVVLIVAAYQESLNLKSLNRLLSSPNQDGNGMRQPFSAGVSKIGLICSTGFYAGRGRCFGDGMRRICCSADNRPLGAFNGRAPGARIDKEGCEIQADCVNTRNSLLSVEASVFDGTGTARKLLHQRVRFEIVRSKLTIRQSRESTHGDGETQ
jgi:hypothetical protein